MKISTHALEKLSNHNWPGNVRELQHSIEKAVIMSDSSVLEPSDFVFHTSGGSSGYDEITLEEMEKKLIFESMKRYGSNLSLVAKNWNNPADSYNKQKI